MKQFYNKLFFLTFVSLFLISCGYYSFTGKSIPLHIKTVQVVLFEDRTDRYDLNFSNVIKEKLLEYIDDYKLMDEDDSKDSDSKIYGTIVSYKEGIISQINEDTADEREMKLTISLNFYDKINKNFIIKKSKISETELYNDSDGETGKTEAFEKMLENICEQSIIKLSSNW